MASKRGNEERGEGEHREVQKRPRIERGGAGPLTDVDCGITEFISIEVAGFHANIKQRYSDFHVREVGADGALVGSLSSRRCARSCNLGN